MELVAERRSVGTRLRQAQFINQDGNDLIDGRIIRQFDGHSLVLCRVVDRHIDSWHIYFGCFGDSGENLFHIALPSLRKSQPRCERKASARVAKFKFSAFGVASLSIAEVTTARRF